MTEQAELAVAERRETTELLPYTKHGAIFKMNRPINDHDKEEGYYVVPAVEYQWPNGLYPWHIEYGLVSDDEVLVCWTNDDEERFILPRLNPDGQESAEYQAYEPGAVITWENSAPGVGQVIWRVDRKDEKGLWGLCISDTRWVPDGDFFA